MDFQSLKQVLPKQSKKWNCDDVYIWLSFIGLEKEYSKFLPYKIDGSCLSQLTERELTNELGIKQKIIVRKLIKCIHHNYQGIKQGLSEYDQYLKNCNIEVMDTQESSQHFFFKNFKKVKHNEQKKQQQKQIQNSPNINTQIHSYQFRQKKELNYTHYHKKDRSNPQESIYQLILQPTQICTLARYSFIQVGGCIGRRSGNQILAIDDSLSEVHCKIEYIKPNYYLSDCSLLSQNKSRVRTGTWIKVEDKMKIQSGMMFEMGQNLFSIEINHLAQKITINRFEPYTFEISKIIERVYTFSAKQKPKITIGRRFSSDLSFPTDTTMSNIHGKFTFVHNNWYLQDLGTTNGTWLLLNQRHLITNGMTFRLGNTVTSYNCKILGSKQDYTGNFLIQKCIKCMNTKRDTLFLPCCHFLFCQECSQKLKLCPKCFSNVNQQIKIFTS